MDFAHLFKGILFFTLATRNFGWLFRILRFIPSTRLEDSGNNFVKSTAKLLKQNNKNIILISPEGTIKVKEWRSGYFWLAKELNWDIRICGFDYKTKRIVRHGNTS